MGDYCPSLHAGLARLLDDLCQYRHSTPCRCSAAAVHDLTIRPVGCRSRPVAVHADEAFRASPARSERAKSRKEAPPARRWAARSGRRSAGATHLPFGPP